MTVVALLLGALLVQPAEAISLRRQCRLACNDAIAACVGAGGRRRHCRRTVLRQCRHAGVTVCSTTTTTTTAPPGLPGLSATTVPLRGTTTTTLAIVNGCDPATASDRRGQTAITVQFGEAPGEVYFYNPACFIVSPGTQVTFSGNFQFHPLVGGEVLNGEKMPDP